MKIHVHNNICTLLKYMMSKCMAIFLILLRVGVRTTKLSTHTNNYDPSADSLYLRCRKLGINYEFPQKDENPYNTKNRKSRMNYKIRQQLKQINMPEKQHSCCTVTT